MLKFLSKPINYFLEIINSKLLNSYLQVLVSLRCPFELQTSMDKLKHKTN